MWDPFCFCAAPTIASPPSPHALPTSPVFHFPSSGLPLLSSSIIFCVLLSTRTTRLTASCSLCPSSSCLPSSHVLPSLSLPPLLLCVVIVPPLPLLLLSLGFLILPFPVSHFSRAMGCSSSTARVSPATSEKYVAPQGEEGSAELGGVPEGEGHVPARRRPQRKKKKKTRATSRPEQLASLFAGLGQAASPPPGALEPRRSSLSNVVSSRPGDSSDSPPLLRGLQGALLEEEGSEESERKHNQEMRGKLDHALAKAGKVATKVVLSSSSNSPLVSLCPPHSSPALPALPHHSLQALGLSSSTRLSRIPAAAPTGWRGVMQPPARRSPRAHLLVAPHPPLGEHAWALALCWPWPVVPIWQGPVGSREEASAGVLTPCRGTAAVVTAGESQRRRNRSTAACTWR